MHLYLLDAKFLRVRVEGLSVNSQGILSLLAVWPTKDQRIIFVKSDCRFRHIHVSMYCFELLAKHLDLFNFSSDTFREDFFLYKFECNAIHERHAQRI